MAKNHGPTVKDDEQYEALRKEGASKAKAARIANASNNTSRSGIGHKGGEAENYEDRTKNELLKRAHEIAVDVTTSMSKDEIIEKLRSH